MEIGSSGLTLNVVAPSLIADTEMFESVMSPQSERAQKLTQAIPVGRLGRGHDVARAVKFFVSPEAGFLTGQVLYVGARADIGSISL